MKKRIISTGAAFALAMSIVMRFGDWLVSVSQPYDTTAELIVGGVGAVVTLAAVIAWALGVVGVFDE